MKDLLRLFTQIALARRSPEDLPASPFLLALTVTGYFAVNYIASLLFPPFNGPWLEHLCFDVVFMLAWYALLLVVMRRPERFLQTASAVYGYQAILSPMFVAAMWLWRRQGQESVWSFPAFALCLALLIWIIAANSYIIKAALEWSMLPSVALVILQALADDLLAVSLFPIPNS
jgi:hypothetical protein